MICSYLLIAQGKQNYRVMASREIMGTRFILDYGLGWLMRLHEHVFYKRSLNTISATCLACIKLLCI